jgi:hypothetical protein
MCPGDIGKIGAAKGFNMSVDMGKNNKYLAKTPGLR